MDLVDGVLGPEADYKLELSEGLLKLSASYAGKGGKADLLLALEPGYFLDKLKAVIPGEIDDAIFDIIKGALEAQKA